MALYWNLSNAMPFFIIGMKQLTTKLYELFEKKMGCRSPVECVLILRSFVIAFFSVIIT